MIKPLPFDLPRSLLGMLLLAVSMAGCGSPSTHYYVLDTAMLKKMNVGDAVLPSVAIRQLEIPPYLDRPHLVRRDQGTQLHIAAYHQWGGRLRDNIARTLADDLAAQLGSPSISAVPQPGSMQAELGVLVDIRQFERLSDGYVHLQLRWQLERAGNTVLSRMQHLSSSERMDSGDYAAMAKAMSELIGDVSKSIATAIMQQTAGKTD